MKLAVLAIVVCAVLCPRPALAAPAPVGTIVFGRGDALWQMPVDASREPTRVVALGRPAADLERITVSESGEVMLLDFGSEQAYATLAAGEVATPKPLECAGDAVLAADGGCILCPAGKAHGDKVWLYLLGDTPRRILTYLGPNPVAFIGASPPAVAVIGSRGLWRVNINPFRRTLVAPHAPESHLLIAPNGQRAVGSYVIDGSEELVGFRLDGEAARRKLITAGVPIVWSADSRWLLVQHQKRACVVRAVGGEYKCWPRFRGLGLSPDGAFALLGRHRDGDSDAPMRLYVGKLAGARPAKPKALIENVTGIAVWMPAKKPGAITTPAAAGSAGGS